MGRPRSCYGTVLARAETGNEQYLMASAEVMKQARWKIIATMLAVTWLNPHVYLIRLSCWAVSADNWLWSQSAGSPSARLARRSYGFWLALHWRPGLRLDCTAKAQRIITILVGW